MRDPRARDAEVPALLAVLLIVAIILIPVTFAIKDAPPASNWRVTPSSVWGK